MSATAEQICCFSVAVAVQHSRLLMADYRYRERLCCPVIAPARSPRDGFVDCLAILSALGRVLE